MSKANNIKSEILEIVKELNAAPDVVSNNISVSSIKYNRDPFIVISMFDNEEDLEQCLDQLRNSLHYTDVEIDQEDGGIVVMVLGAY